MANHAESGVHQSSAIERGRNSPLRRRRVYAQRLTVEAIRRGYSWQAYEPRLLQMYQRNSNNSHGSATPHSGATKRTLRRPLVLALTSGPDPKQAVGGLTPEDVLFEGEQSRAA